MRERKRTSIVDALQFLFAGTSPVVVRTPALEANAWPGVSTYAVIHTRVWQARVAEKPSHY